MDGNTRFRRLYRLDDGAELLAVAAQARPDDDVSDDGNVEITLTTDAKSSVVLHWGVGTPRDRSWRPPAAALQPEGSEAHEGGVLTSASADLFWVKPGAARSCLHAFPFCVRSCWQVGAQSRGRCLSAG